MVARFWLQEDQRDRSYQYQDEITNEMLAESFGFQENQLELITSIGAFRFADRPKYVGTTFYEGRITSLPKAERVMPEILSAAIELSECSVTVANVDGLLTKYLPGGSEYTTFIGENVFIHMCLRNVASSQKPIFIGTVSHENGVSYNTKEITFRFRDKLDFLNNKYPLESITKEAYPNAADDAIGKLIPIALGDWTAGWEWVENGTASFSDESGIDKVNVNVINMTPKGVGGGIPGHAVSQAEGIPAVYFLFSTGGRAGKTYNPCNIEDVIIKRGNSYFWAQFSPDPIEMGGHWTCLVTHVKMRNISGDIEYVPYFYTQGDTAIIKVKIPIDGDTWNELRDTSPLEQAKEALIALGRVSASDFDGVSFSKMRDALLASSASSGVGKIVIQGDYPMGGNRFFDGGYISLQLYKANGQVYTFCAYFNDIITGMPYPDEAFANQFDNIIMIGTANFDTNNLSDGGNAAKLAEWICLNLNLSLNSQTNKLCKFELSVVSDTEAYIYVLPYYIGLAGTPLIMGLPFTWVVESTTVVEDGIKTRCYFGDEDKTVLGSVSSLLKCVLVDMYINRDLKIAFSSLWPKHFPERNMMQAIAQYDISEESVEVLSDSRNFFTCAQANYSWLYWLESASSQTKKLKNTNAENMVGRSIVKEIDLPNVYIETQAIDILKTYIRLASAYLVTIKMKVGWKHLLRDLGEFVQVSFVLGSLNFDRVPCMIRRISILPEVTGSALELVSFVNFSYPQYESPSASRNLSSYDVTLDDA